MLAGWWAHFPNHRSSRQNRLFPCPGPPVAHGRFSTCALRYNAWRPQHHHRPNQSYPDHRSACSVRKMAAPSVPWCRRPRYHHVDDIYRSHHRRYGPISCRTCSSHCPAHSWRITRADVPVSGHHEHRVRHAQ